MTPTTPPPVEYTVHPKEETYFAIKVFFSLIFYYLIGMFFYIVYSQQSTLLQREWDLILIYMMAAVLYVFGSFLFKIGYLKGNAVKVSEEQFPDIYKIASSQAERLGFDNVPDVYILQSGGILNAFATQFAGTNYVVIYSDVLVAAYEQDIKVLEFIIGHEMGHIKRGHILKGFLLFPAALIPLLSSAYSRSCEYTCDRIGFSLCPEGAPKGMLLLAAGRTLSSRVNVKAFTEQTYTEAGFTRWFAEKLSSHPNLTKRLQEFEYLTPERPSASQPKAATSEDEQSTQENGHNTPFIN